MRVAAPDLAKLRAAQAVKPRTADTAGFGVAAAAALSSLVSETPAANPAAAAVPERPTIDTVAARLYGRNARLETAVALNERYGMVWLTPDAANDTAGVLPFRVFGLDAKTNRMRSLVPVVDRRGGLRYVAANDLYRGEVIFGFRDSLAPDGVVELDEPLQITVGGTVESVEPGRFVIRRINEVAERVALSSRRRPTAPVLTLHPSFSAQALDIPIPVLIDSLTVRAPRRMRGLGTQEATIEVSVPAGVLGTDDSIEVSVLPTYGSIAPPTALYVKNNRSAKIRLRSSGLGIDTVAIASGPMVAEPVVITYDPPWMLLLLAIAGALVGAALRWWSARQKDPKARFPGPRAAVSVLVIAALSVGLDQFGKGFALVYSEVMVFVLAAIFAAGLKALDWTSEGA